MNSINMNKNIKLFNDDCMNIMSKYDDKYFDLAIVDPPYGINKDGNTKGLKETEKTDEHQKKVRSGKAFGWKFYEKKDWDQDIPKKEYFDELFRVSKNQIIFGGNYFTDYLYPSRGWIFWDKGQDISMSDGELAWTSFDKALRRKVFFRNTIWSNHLRMEKTPIHPTQKPVKLYTWILENYAEKGLKILDTHLGSGSSAISCHYYGVQEFIGVELDKDYYNLTFNRINQETSQMSYL
ncbi:MAG: DNA modification methylase [Haliea sp.]|nr:DNA modification methylase [Haliea sp.]